MEELIAITIHFQHTANGKPSQVFHKSFSQHFGSFTHFLHRFSTSKTGEEKTSPEVAKPDPTTTI